MGGRVLNLDHYHTQQCETPQHYNTHSKVALQCIYPWLQPARTTSHIYRREKPILVHV